MARSFGGLALGLSLVLALHFHLRHVIDPGWIVEDARQHVFWTYRFADPELFPGDPLVRFISGPKFAPPGYYALYAAGARVLDALLFSKLVGLALAFASGLLAFRIGRRLAGPFAGVLATLAVGLTLFDDLRGGLPRCFAFPLLLYFLDGLIARRPLPTGLAFVLAALFYPPVILVMGALMPVWIFERGAPGPWARAKSLLLPLGVPAAAAALVLLWSYVVADRAFAGPMVSAAEAWSMPEFHRGGRAAFFDEDPVRFWLGDRRYNRSATNLLRRNVLFPLLACLALALLLRRRFRVPRELLALFGAGLVLYGVAHLALFNLHHPSRYTMYAWPLAFLLTASTNLAAMIGERGPRLLARIPRRAALAAMALALAAIVAAACLRERKEAPPEVRALLAAVAALPKDAVVAGLPNELDDVPLRARRSVLANRELALPYYAAYYALVRERIGQSLALLTARDRDQVRRLAARSGATHLLVDRRLYDGDPALRPRLEKPYDEELARMLQGQGVPLFAGEEHGFEVLHDGGRFVLVALRG